MERIKMKDPPGCKVNLDMIWISPSVEDGDEHFRVALVEFVPSKRISQPASKRVENVCHLRVLAIVRLGLWSSSQGNFLAIALPLL